MSTVRDVGDRINVRYESRNADGVLTNTTMTLAVTSPSGTVSNPSITNTSTGVYDAAFTLTEAELWRWTWTASGTIVDVAYGEVLAKTVAPPAYASLPSLKLALAGRQAGSTTALAMDTGRDELLTAALFAASRAVDAYTGRRFYADTSTSARTYRPRGRVTHCADGDLLIIDDVSSTTGLTVETGSAGSSTWTTLATTAYETSPLNAITRLEPITGILRVAARWDISPITRVRVTARWGWPVVPDVVTQATLIQAARLYRRKDSPEGVVGNAEWGTVRVSRVDPDVQALLAHLRLPGVG